MNLLRNQEPEICAQAETLFSVFRSSSIVQSTQGNHYPNNIIIKRSIIKTLKRLSFKKSRRVFDTFFLEYSLIQECYHSQISSVESLLKVIALFKLINRFSENEKNEIILAANRLYFNNGNNGLSALSSKTQEAIRNFASTYSYIFTTNYDCIFDDACKESDKVMHLHGGFYLKDRNHKSKEKLPPDKAYLIWGVNGEEKVQQLQGGLLVDRDHMFMVDNTGRLIYTQSTLGLYLHKLETQCIDQLDIFGYSGENDQHINLTISKNTNIKRVNYFCDPYDVNNPGKNAKIRKQFSLSDDVQLSLLSWKEVWDRIPLC